MSDVAVRVEGLGKKFQIGHQKNGDLRNAFVHTVRGFFSKKAAHKEEFWALKDIDFEIKRGEVVGIIGRNGAGKSTLLKILSRITGPTTGRFEIDGRVSSLLEVGTGFHMELTGRENVFLNGTILGMRRAEIKRKFDEIVAFSGVENFIDTPVKHYSSGMKVRLAFSVAAHLEPEVLIIDEVLAVGDAEFQKKCLGKMDEVSKREGRTILFVSHNMSAIEGLCRTGIVLENGSIQFCGNISDSISEYLTRFQKEIGIRWCRPRGETERDLEISHSEIELRENQPAHKLVISTFLRSKRPHGKAFIAYDLKFEDNTPLMQAIPKEDPFIDYAAEGQYLVTGIDLPPLIPGNYKLSIWVGPHYSETYDWQQEILMFRIDSSPVPGRTYPHAKRNGYIIPKSYLLP